MTVVMTADVMADATVDVVADVDVVTITIILVSNLVTLAKIVIQTVTTAAVTADADVDVVTTTITLVSNLVIIIALAVVNLLVVLAKIQQLGEDVIKLLPLNKQDGTSYLGCPIFF